MAFQLPTSNPPRHFDLAKLRVTAGACSVQGVGRENNEDSDYVSPSGKLFIVADGMGGHRAGELASRFVVDSITHELERLLDDDLSDEEVKRHVRVAFDHANCLLLDLTESDTEREGAGSTAVLALLFGDRLFVSGVGDSRAYLLRRGTIDTLTHDDSLPRHLQRLGMITAEEAETHPARNQLLAYLGMKNFRSDQEIRLIRVLPADRVLLCSDGLTDVVSDSQIKDVLASTDNAEVAARLLVRTAQENGANDDVTCVVFVVHDVPAIDPQVEFTGLRAMIQWIAQLWTGERQALPT